MKKQMCMVKPYYILFKRLGLFAVRLPSLSRGNGLGLWHNFLCFYPCFAWVYFLIKFTLFYNLQKKEIHADDLDDGYKVVTSETKE